MSGIKLLFDGSYKMLTFIFSAGEDWCHLPTLCPEKRKRRFVSSG